MQVLIRGFVYLGVTGWALRMVLRLFLIACILCLSMVL